jgi:nucleotide-binding universal stress UspA family protein
MTSSAARSQEPDAGDAAVGRIIVGVDDSEAGLAALREAVALAVLHHAQLVAVRAWALGLPRHGGRRLRHLAHPHVVLYFSGTEQRVAARVLTRRALRTAVPDIPAGLDLVIETPAGDPAVVLTSMAARPGDLVVVGSGRTWTARGLVHGSVTAYCQRHARCPVVVVPGRGSRHRGPASRGAPAAGPAS